MALTNGTKLGPYEKILIATERLALKALTAHRIAGEVRGKNGDAAARPGRD